MKKLDVGTKLTWEYIDEAGVKKKTKGVIIACDTIDYMTLEPLYDIQLDEVDFLGRAIVVENVPAAKIKIRKR